MSINMDLVNQLFQLGQQQLNGALDTVLGQLTTNVQGALGELVNSLNGQLAGIIGGLGGLFGKRALQAQQIQSIINQVQSLIQSAPAMLSQLQSQITGTLSNFLSTALGFLGTLSTPQLRAAIFTQAQIAKAEIADAFNAILNEALGHLTSIATNLANVGLASILTALQGKRGLLDGFGDIWNGLTSTLSGHIDNLTTTLTATGQALLGAVTPHLQDLQDQLTNHALNAAQSLLGTLANISGALSGKRGIWDDLLAQLNGAVSSVTSSLQQTGQALLGAVTPHLQDLQDQLTNHALNAAQSLLGTLGNISGALSG